MDDYKVTTSLEKIEALEKRIHETEEAMEQSAAMLSTTPEKEQQGAINEKNRRREEAVAEAKQRIDVERAEMNGELQ